MNRSSEQIYRSRLSILLIGFCLLTPTATADTGYLSTGEAIGVGVGSLTIFKLGNYIKRANADSKPRWVKPLGFEEKISRFFGRQPGLGRQNFLDSDFGSAVTTLGAGALLAVTDLSYERNERNKDLWQNQFVFYCGALATKGVTDVFKGVVARQRPLLYCAPELAAQREKPDHAEDHYSFFSGHTSSAFYAMTFLNLRVRAAMRQEMTVDGYRKHRWISPAICFGWAMFVAGSRIQAYQHYLTDIAAGALAGYLIGELYYSLSDDITPSGDGSPTPLYLQVRIGF